MVKGRVTQTHADITLVDARCPATGTFEKRTTGKLGDKRNRGSYSRETQTSLEHTTRTAVAGIALNGITTCLQKIEVDKTQRTAGGVTSYYHEHRDPLITPSGGPTAAPPTPKCPAGPDPVLCHVQLIRPPAILTPLSPHMELVSVTDGT